MATPDRPKQHDAIADEIRQAIAYSTYEETVELIKNNNVNILDGDDQTPLMYSIIYNKKEVFNWLLQQNVDVNICDRNGRTALEYAVQDNHINYAKTLLEEGAKASIKDGYGNTPLWRATFNSRGNYELVKLLVSYGADPQSKNNSGMSPLDFATQIDDAELINILG